jgi:hypothetical protein
MAVHRLLTCAALAVCANALYPAPGFATPWEGPPGTVIYFDPIDYVGDEAGDYRFDIKGESPDGEFSFYGEAEFVAREPTEKGQAVYLTYCGAYFEYAEEAEAFLLKGKGFQLESDGGSGASGAINSEVVENTGLYETFDHLIKVTFEGEFRGACRLRVETKKSGPIIREMGPAGRGYYHVGTVVADEGLYLRAAPAPRAQVIKVLPNKTKVFLTGGSHVCAESLFDYVTFVEVLAGDDRGWAAWVDTGTGYEYYYMEVRGLGVR